MVDKNLFLYDLAAVAIMKNEGRYLREWLDYHLLAGVDHFYLYDNGSTDNQREIAAPYVEAGLVDYIPAPGNIMQMPAYNDAVKNFRFKCRYMTFIDCDEFIYPKDGRSIAEVVDEILPHDETAAGVAINWQIFGSGGQERADYSRGVLERFTRRAPKNWSTPLPSSNVIGGNVHVKTLANPRKIKFLCYPHYPNYFGRCHSVNERGNIVEAYNNDPVTADKIVINHYFAKSYEEFLTKQARGRADLPKKHDDDFFHAYDRNDEFDDGILHYLAARADKFTVESDERRLERVQRALTKNLSMAAAGKATDLETALTLRAVSSHLRGRFPDSSYWRLCEEASLGAVINSLRVVEISDAELFISELPKILRLPYPATKELFTTANDLILQLMDAFHENRMWKDFVDLDLLRGILNLGADNFAER